MVREQKGIGGKERKRDDRTDSVLWPGLDGAERRERHKKDRETTSGLLAVDARCADTLFPLKLVSITPPRELRKYVRTYVRTYGGS